MFHTGACWHEGVSFALAIVAPESAEDTLGVLPQYFSRAVVQTGADRIHGATLCALAREGATKAIHQDGLVQRLRQVAADSQVQHALPDAFFRLGRDQDRRDLVSGRDQMPIN